MFGISVFGIKVLVLFRVEWELTFGGARSRIWGSAGACPLSTHQAIVEMLSTAQQRALEAVRRALTPEYPDASHLPSSHALTSHAQLEKPHETCE